MPFHPWLPAAMVAPTPVSAYLHAASMVKAGVYLVARLAPGFADLAVWWVPVVVVGLATMLVGGWRALAATDLKQLLAFGTVSQLGFLMVLFGAGSGIAALAGAAMLLAHGLFKAPLFLVVGTIDHTTGTRDMRKLSGLARALPGTALAAGLAVASMAGLPPLLGFAAKEAAFEAFLHEGGARGWAVEFGLLAGSTLTVAYSARFLWGAFARKPGREPTAVRHRPALTLTVPTWVCAVAGFALGVGAPLVDVLTASYADTYADLGGYHLALWHGPGLPLLFSAVVVVGGLVLHRVRDRVTILSGHSPLDAQHVYERTVSGIGRVAVAVTGRLQAGSLPAYLGTILVAFVVLPGTATVLAGAWPATVRHAQRGDPGAARDRRDRGRDRRHAGPAAVDRGAAGRRDRVRRRWVLRRGRGARPRAGAVPRRDRCRWWCSCSCCGGCPPTSPEERPPRRVRVPKAVPGSCGGHGGGHRRGALGWCTQPASARADSVRLAPEGDGLQR